MKKLVSEGFSLGQIQKVEEEVKNLLNRQDYTKPMLVAFAGRLTDKLKD